MLFCSKSLILKSNHAQFAHVPLYKRATVIHSLTLLFTKEQIALVALFKKSDVIDTLVILADCLQKMSDTLENFVFFVCFWQIFPFFPKNKSLPSLFAHLLFFKEGLERFAPIALNKRAIVSDSLRSLMTKEWPWAIRSGHSWQKSNRSDSLFFMRESLFRSFSHQKRAHCSKNQWSIS